MIDQKRTGASEEWISYSRRDIVLSTAMGAVYLVSSWWPAALAEILRIDEQIGIADVRTRALVALAQASAVFLPTAMVFSVALLGPTSGLRRSLRGVNWAVAVVAAVAASAVGLLLDASRYWPWLWRYNSEASFPLAGALIQKRQIVATMFWFAIWAGFIPVIEEVIFRGAVLQGIRRFVKNDFVPIVISGVAFGLVHIGPALSPSGAGIRNAVFATVFGLVAAVITWERKGRLDGAIGLHVGHSATSMIALLLERHGANG